MRALPLSLAAICLFISAFSVLATAAEDTPSSKVDGTFFIPKEVPSFDNRLVEIRLYKYDPRIADKGADLVEKIEIKDFSHAQGKETKKDFVVGAKGELEPKMGYYVTLFVLQNQQRTHIGECQHSPRDLCKVLTNGEPNRIHLKVREVNK